MTKAAIDNEIHQRWLAEQDEKDRRELRDEFALAALKFGPEVLLAGMSKDWPVPPEHIGEKVYRIADACMAARDKPAEPMEGK